MSNRRTFVGLSAAAAAALTGMPLACAPGRMDRLSNALAAAQGAKPDAVAEDEDFWREVRAAFVLDPELINLNHG